MKDSKPFFRFVLIAFAFVAGSFTAVFSQEPPTGPSNKWVRVETVDKEISVAMPSGFIVDAEKRELDQRFKIFGFEDGVLMEFSVRHLSQPPISLGRARPTKGKTTDFVQGRIKGTRIVSEDNAEYYFENIYLTSDKTLYRLSVMSRAKNHNAIARFLRSIKINDKPLFVIEKKIDEPSDLISIESLKTSPEVVEAFARKIVKGERVTAKSGEPVDKYLYDYGKFSRPPLILAKGWPDWWPRSDNRMSYESQTAILRVELLASGQVGKITSHAKADDGFVKACIEAARKIRFIPAQIDGKNVDSTEIVDYSMTVTTITSLTMRP